MRLKEKRHIFDCGAELIYKKNMITKSTALRICFACGARCDGDVAGLAHFCEHMFFTGTKTEDKQKITKQYFDFINANAFTNTQEITFVGEIFTRELKNYLSLVAKLITKSTFSQKNVENEKKVVLQEIVQGADDFDIISARHYGYLLYNKEYLENGVLGTKKSVSSITSKMVKDYVQKYFVANNCKIFITSPLEIEEVISLCENELLSKLNINPNLEELPYDAVKITDKSSSNITHRNINKNFLYLGIKTNISRADLKKLSYVWALSDIMSDYSEGILKTLRLEKGLVYSGHFFFDDNKYDGELVFKTELEKDNIKPCITCLIDYIKRLRTQGIDQKLIDKHLKRNSYAIETNVDTPKIVVSDLETFKRYDRIFTIFDVNKYQNEMTKRDLDELIKEIFTNPNIVCLVYGDATKQDIFTIKEIKDMFK